MATLDTPSLNCSGLTDVFLHLYSEYLADGGDTQSIQVSVDGGATFTDIFQYQKALQNTEEDAWFNRFTFAVPQAAGKSDVIFRFYSAGADPGETEGFWAIDNVEVTGNGVVIQPTPVPTPTPVPVLLSVGFDEATVEAAGFAYNPPTGFSAASISVGDVPPGAGTDGRGLIVQAGQGQGMLLITNNPVPVGPGPVLVTVWVRGTNLGMSAALAALNGGLDGQLGYTMADNTDLPVDSWGRLVLAYDPPNDSVHLGLQVAAREAGTVYFDNATVQELPDLESEPVTLDVAGSFDAGTEGILQNVNGDTGTVDYASRPGEVVLSITDTDDAANIGILASSLQGSFPHLLLASVDARLLSGSGGTTALVMTNGNGNVGVFFYNSGLPGIDQPPATITVAGSFETENPALPILCVVQNGGPGVTSQLAVDNLEVRRLTGGGL